MGMINSAERKYSKGKSKIIEPFQIIIQYMNTEIGSCVL